MCSLLTSPPPPELLETPPTRNHTHLSLTSQAQAETEGNTCPSGPLTFTGDLDRWRWGRWRWRWHSNNNDFVLILDLSHLRCCTILFCLLPSTYPSHIDTFVRVDPSPSPLRASPSPKSSLGAASETSSIHTRSQSLAKKLAAIGPPSVPIIIWPRERRRWSEICICTVHRTLGI